MSDPLVPAGGPPTSPVRILVVEDNPQILKNLVKVLSAQSDLVVVGEAMDGETGVRLVDALKPDFVLLDLELPGIDGIQVTQRVKGRHPEIDVLILTTFDDETKVYQAVQAGAGGYLVKRVSPARIISAIKEVREGGTVIESVIARRFWNYFQSVRAQAAGVDPWGLSSEERDVLQYIAKGLSNAEVGRVMAMDRRRVRTQLGHIYKKLGVKTHVEAVVKALQAGIVDV
jgi:DNA-binding NarL/FixJ family response regulator